MKVVAHWPRVVLAAGLLLLYLPMMVLLVPLLYQWLVGTAAASFTLFWQDEALLKALQVSFQVALHASSLALLLGFIIAFVTMRKQRAIGQTSFVSRAMTMLLVIPHWVPGLIVICCLSVLLTSLRIEVKGQEMMVLTLVHALLGSALVTVVISLWLLKQDPSLEEAALDLGAKPLSVFFHVTLPLMLPTLVISWLLSFVLSFNDYVVASFIFGTEYPVTLPVLLFASIRQGQGTWIPVFAFLLIPILFLIGMLLWYGMRQVKKKWLQQHLGRG